MNHVYKIDREDGNERTIHFRAGTRIDDTLRALIKGPLLAPSLRRVSDHIFRLRQQGILIDTEYREQHEQGMQRYGVYHLRTKIVPVAKIGGAV